MIDEPAVLVEREETLSIARSVCQAKWGAPAQELPDHRPTPAIFTLWVGYAKRLAAALLTKTERRETVARFVNFAYAAAEEGDAGAAKSWLKDAVRALQAESTDTEGPA